MPDMSEFHETEEEMEDRCDAQRDSEKLDYHDCPGAALGTCEPTNPQPDCPDCEGKGYIALAPMTGIWQ